MLLGNGRNEWKEKGRKEGKEGGEGNREHQIKSSSILFRFVHYEYSHYLNDGLVVCAWKGAWKRILFVIVLRCLFACLALCFHCIVDSLSALLLILECWVVSSASHSRHFSRPSPSLFPWRASRSISCPRPQLDHVVCCARTEDGSCREASECSSTVSNYAADHAISDYASDHAVSDCIADHTCSSTGSDVTADHACYDPISNYAADLSSHIVM